MRVLWPWRDMSWSNSARKRFRSSTPAAAPREQQSRWGAQGFLVIALPAGETSHHDPPNVLFPSPPLTPPMAPIPGALRSVDEPRGADRSGCERWAARAREAARALCRARAGVPGARRVPSAGDAHLQQPADKLEPSDPRGGCAFGGGVEHASSAGVERAPHRRGLRGPATNVAARSGITTPVKPGLRRFACSAPRRYCVASGAPSRERAPSVVVPIARYSY